MFMVREVCLVESVFFFGTLVIAAAAFYLSYIWYVHRKYDHIPGPKRTSFVFGNTAEVLSGFKKGSCLVQMVLDWMHEHGHTIKVFFAHKVIVFTADPQAIKTILVTKNFTKPPALISYIFGARVVGKSILVETSKQSWAKRRAIYNPSFHRSFLKRMVPQFNATADKLMNKLATFADGETVINIESYLNRTTLDAISHVAFNMDMNSIEKEENPFPEAVHKTMNGISQSLRWTTYQKYNPFYRRAFRKETKEACTLLRQFAREVVDQRKAMIARGEEPPQDILNSILKAGEELKDVNMDVMLDDFLTFLIAGQETTANSLSFTLMELGRQPEILHRLREEVETVVGNKSTIDYESIGKLEYMSMVIKESLRLYPTAGHVLRHTEEDMFFDGYHVPAGTNVFLEIFSASRMPEFVSDPYEFKPDRFDPNAVNRPSMYSTFPFSLGPRNCIGQAFAQIEMKVFLCKFLHRFIYELHPDQCFEIKEVFTLRPKGGVRIILTHRTVPSH